MKLMQTTTKTIKTTVKSEIMMIVKIMFTASNFKLGISCVLTNIVEHAVHGKCSIFVADKSLNETLVVT